MLKKLLSATLILVFSDVSFAKVIDLYQAPLSSLKQFPLVQNGKKTVPKAASFTINNNVLQQVNQSQEQAKTIKRYQQLYRGLPVIGAQIIITQDLQSGNGAPQVNGRVLEDIQLNIHPLLTKEHALDIAKKSWFNFNPSMKIEEENSELQIRAEKNDALKLVYLASFKSIDKDNKPAWPFFVIDAQSGELIKQWNNIKNFSDNGPGGNEKVHEYWYGKDGLPALDVTKKGETCVMETSTVKLINLQTKWDWANALVSPFEYTCGNNQEDLINGAFSPTNDAYFFGHVIVNMYKDWYGVNALQNANGTAMQLVMRVHFGKGYDNAHWDGTSMSFGDGNDFYPLVSLDVAGHEVAHGFTEQHANLEYNDQSGALNESMSDMGGQATRAYLLESLPNLYNRVYLEPNVITWGIGETIIRDSFGKALRFMDFPSADGSSADCLDKEIAQSKGIYCAINYADVVAYAEANYPDPQSRQNFIVHTASGVFNKAFYLLANNIGIKKAYHAMIVANSKYWTPTTDFVQGACGVLYAAHDLAINVDMVRSVFSQVGVDTASCSI